MGNNAVAFFNTFVSYLVVYVVFGACIVAAVFAGIAVRKRKNAKEEAASVTETKADETEQ
jgi:hypothetical protein